MPVTTQHLPGALVGTIVRDTDADATAEANVRNGATTLYYIFYDNPNASTQYLKLWDAVSPTVGTTAPDFIFPLTASVQRVIWPAGGGGERFTTGLSYACVTAGGTAGTTSPTSNVVVELGVS